MFKFTTTSVRTTIVGLVAILLFISKTQVVKAGSCWFIRMDDGKCSELITRNVKRDECCAAGMDVGYSENDVSDVELFFIMAFKKTANCMPCAKNCENAECGIHRRCIMKDDQPKCVCSPNCKKAKKLNHSKKLKADRQNKRPLHLKNLNKNANVNVTNDDDDGAAVDRSAQKNQTKTHKNMNQRNNNLGVRQNRRHKQQQQQDGNLQHPTTATTIKKKKKHMNESSAMMVADDTRQQRLQQRQRVVVAGSSPPGGAVVEDNESRQHHRLNVRQFDNHGVRHKNKKLGNHSRNVVASKRRHINLMYHEDDEDNLRRVMNLNDTEAVLQITEKRIRGGDLMNNFIAVSENNFINDNSILLTGEEYMVNPVCGTDGHTYKTECQLKKRACRLESSLAVAYRGHCKTTCKYVECPTGQHCLEDQNAIPHCVNCTRQCTMHPTNEVCGADGNTYRNLCELKQKACLTGHAIPLAYKGPCQDGANCDTVKCKDRQICMEDLMTHRPRCVSCSFKCNKKRLMPDSKQRYAKVCGNNNHTYNSWCHMVRASCKTRLYIDVKHHGPCRM